LSVVRDVSQRIEAKRHLLQQVVIRTREQATVLQVSQILASALQLKPGLILDQLRSILDYTQAGLFALDGSDLVPLAVRGPQPLEQAVPFRIRMNGPITLTTLFKDNAPIRMPMCRAMTWPPSTSGHFLRIRPPSCWPGCEPGCGCRSP
jgi:hypothetical protein